MLLQHLSSGTSTTTENAHLTIPLLETEREAHQAELEEVAAAMQKQFEEVQKLEQYSADLDTRRAELDELQTVTGRWAIECERCSSNFSPSRVSRCWKTRRRPRAITP